jgi:hypothetical protein
VYPNSMEYQRYCRSFRRTMDWPESTEPAGPSLPAESATAAVLVALAWVYARCVGVITFSCPDIKRVSRGGRTTLMGQCGKATTMRETAV